MSNLNQQIGLSVQATINTLGNKIGVLEINEANVTPTLLLTDAELFLYGVEITIAKTLQDQANLAVVTYTLTPAESAAIGVLQTRLTAVEAVYITAMIARAPNLFT